MSDTLLTINAETTAANQSFLKRHEFLLFSIIGFVAKSALLVRLPYREWYINSFWTGLIIAYFYCFFRFRYKATPPLITVFCLMMAVLMDVIGNVFHLYNTAILGIQYDDYTHFLGSACSLVPAMWVFRTTSRRMGIRLPADMMGFLSVCITFSLCSWYEVLELWDEQFWGDMTRIWTTQDTAKDLQWDLAGIIFAALICTGVYKLLDRREAAAPLNP